jgi:hypothetical protein
MLKMNTSKAPTNQGGSFGYLGSNISEELINRAFALGRVFTTGMTVDTLKS